MATEKNNYIVAKFGGTSVGSSLAIAKTAEIIIDKKLNLVIASATAGTTDELSEIAMTSSTLDWEKTEVKIAAIKKKHQTIAQQLEVSTICNEAIDSLVAELTTIASGQYYLKETTRRAIDRILSIGERLSTCLLAAAINKISNQQNATYLDARNVIITNSIHGNARPDQKLSQEKSDKLLLPILKKKSIIVTQGFIGRSSEGFTTTLGRGGSDFSAAIFAELIEAIELQIWTDVPGIATADPRIVKATKNIRDLHYEEAAELASAGAKILFPPTVIPAERANIPIRVLSTFQPDNEGTKISKNVTTRPLIRAVTAKKNQHLITVSTPFMSAGSSGFAAGVFGIFAKHQLPIDQITTSETSVAMTVNDKLFLEHEELFHELRGIGEIEFEHNLSVVSIIGNRINTSANLSYRAFKGLFDSGKDINVRMMLQGANKHVQAFVVADDDADSVVQILHKTLIEDET
jgi:aspartate kinase